MEINTTGSPKWHDRAHTSVGLAIVDAMGTSKEPQELREVVAVRSTCPAATYPAHGTMWEGSKVKLFWSSELLLPSGKVCLWGSMPLRMGCPCGLKVAFLSTPLPWSGQGCRKGNPHPWSRAKTWEASAQSKRPPPGGCWQAPRAGHQADGWCNHVRTPWVCHSVPQLPTLCQHLSCAFVPPRILSCLLPHEEQWFYPHAKFLKTPCNISFLALSAATRYGDLPSEPYPCANLPLLKQKRDGHRMTRCFPLVNWNFVFPDSCWAGLPVSLYTAQMSQACVLPGRSCVPGWKQPQRKTGIDIC